MVRRLRSLKQHGVPPRVRLRGGVAIPGNTTEWILVAFALAAFVLATAAAVGVFRMRYSRGGPGRSSGRPDADQFAWSDEREAEFSSMLAAAEDEVGRLRQQLDVATTIDLDETLERTLRAAVDRQPGDAAAIMLPRAEGEEPIIAALGMPVEEIAAEALVWQGTDAVRAIKVSFRYSPGSVPSGMAGGVAVPLHPRRGVKRGTLAVFWRRGDRTVTDEDVDRLEELAGASSLALENALVLRDANERADRDALTGLYNHRFFHEALEKEVTRTLRYGRSLTLVLFDLDDFKSVNDRVGHLRGDALLGELGERLAKIVRGADVACRVGGDEFAVLLPESHLQDGEQLARRFEEVVKRFEGDGSLGVSAGIAELQPEEQPLSLYERADKALYGGKETRGRHHDWPRTGGGRAN